jgi:hypothetical protein
LAGVRDDRLRWNIAGKEIDVLSELIADDIEMFQAGIRAEFTDGRHLLFAEFFLGDISGGTATDSDYGGDRRSGLYSKSISDVGGRNARDLSAGVGRRFDFGAGRWGLTPLVGGSRNRLELVLTDAVQVVAEPGRTPPAGHVPGMAGTYEATWTEFWVGAEIRRGIGRNGEIYGVLRRHWFDFRAKADWNLRRDLARPVGFVQEASGAGLDGELGGTWTVSDRLAFDLRLAYRDRTAKHGTDTLFHKTGRTSEHPLNEVSWRSRSIFAGIRCSF